MFFFCLRDAPNKERGGWMGGGGGAGRTKNLNNVAIRKADVRGLGFRVGVRGSVLCTPRPSVGSGPRG